MPQFTFKAYTAEQRDRKFRELVLYVLTKCSTDARLGNTKLYKILHLADFLCFEQLGYPLTGAEYRKREHGTCPAMGLPVLLDMHELGEIEIRKRLVGIKRQNAYRALKPPTPGFFTGAEMAVIDQAIQRFEGMTNSEAAEASHGIAWKIHKLDEPVPYEAGLLSDSPPDSQAIETARMLAGKLETLGR